MDIWELALPEEDYNLHEFFPKKIPYHLQPLLELRIKLILKENTTLRGGDIKVVNTCLIIGSEIKETRVIPTFIQKTNICAIYKGRGDVLGLESDWGIFLITIFRTILMKIVYKNSYSIIDQAMSDSNICARKHKNIRNPILS